MESLEDAKSQWLESAIALNLEVPDAVGDQDEFSGKFTVRLPKSLHRHLAHMALLEGVSLNQYVVYLLSGRHTEMIKGIVRGIRGQVEDPGRDPERPAEGVP